MKLGFFLVFILFSCQTFSQSLGIDHIRAINLINDKGNDASHEDELILFLATYSSQYDSLLNWTNSNILKLEDSSQIENTNLILPLNDLDSNDLILIVLVQVKSKNTPLKISEEIKRSFLQYANFPKNLLVEKIRYALKDDFLIHAKFYSLEELSKLDKLYLIKGMSILNKFEYELSLNF